MPAKLNITPAGVTIRTTLAPRSTINRLPLESNASWYGVLIAALVAGPPLPAFPTVPFPANVVITPAGVIFRIRPFNESET